MEGLVYQKEAVEKSFSNFIEGLEGPPKLPGADMGHHELNMAIGGHMRKKLTTIAGRSGHGKTASVIPMFDACTRIVSGKRPAYLFLTWEMPSEEVVDRYISFKSGLSWRMLFQATKLMSKEKLNEVKSYYEGAKSLSVVYQELSTDLDHIRELTSWFSEMCDKKSSIEGVEIVPVVLIDYIGMAKFTGSNELRTHKISEMMNGLKGVAKSEDSHIIVLAQINRSADSQDLPDRKDLSDSQGIEQASDNLIILHRPEYVNADTIQVGDIKMPSKDKAMFRLMKGRSFGTGDIIVNCEARHSRFWSLDHAFGFEYWKMYEDERFWMKTFGLI